MAQTTTCRLCIKASDDCKSLYQDNGRPSRLYDLTVEYFHPKIVNMKMAQHLTDLCLECYCHIDEFHTFQMSIMEAQKFLVEEYNSVTIKREMDAEEDLPLESPTTVKQECLSLSENEQSQDSVRFEHNTREEKQDFIIKPELEIIDVRDTNVVVADNPTTSTNKRKLKSNLVSTQPGTDDATICLGSDTISAVYRSSKEDLAKEFNCKLCGKSYAGKKRLRFHLKKYHPGFCPSNLDPEYDAVTQSFRCKLCSARFAQKRHLTNHMQTRHANKGESVPKDEHNLVKCSVCGLSYSCYKGLRRHWNKSHPDMYNSDYDSTTDSYKCKLCGKMFTTKRIFATHMTKRHKQRNCVAKEESNNSRPKDVEDKASENFTDGVIGKPYIQHEGDMPDMPDSHASKDPADQVNVDTDIALEASGKFNCNLCDSSYGSRTILLRHLKYHHPGVQPEMFCADNDYDATTNRFKCKHCGTLFLKKRYLMTHMQHQHNGSTPARKIVQKMFTCNSCGLAYQRFDSLKRHIKVKHTQKQIWSLAGLDYDYDESAKTFACKICGNTYGLKPNFIKHMETMHPEAGQMAANHDNSTMDDGIDEQAFKCRLCERAFKLEATFKQHMERRHGEKSDTRCSFEFDYDESTKMFKCKLCSKAFKSKGALKKHMESQHWENNEVSEKIVYDDTSRKFKCKLCQKSFEYKRILIAHLMRQHGKKYASKYECSKCSSSFLTKSGLTQHCNTVHCPSRVYPCKECQQTFKKFKDFYFHRQKMHSIKNEQQGDGSEVLVLESRLET